jgi:hypothetical protein
MRIGERESRGRQSFGWKERRDERHVVALERGLLTENRVYDYRVTIINLRLRVHVML